MYKRLTLSLAMLAVGAAMLAASGIASTGSAHKQSASQGSVAKQGGILKASLFAGIETKHEYTMAHSYGGYTTLMTFLGVSCFGLRMLESVALMKPVNLVSCAAASLIFFWAHLIDFRVGLPLAAANLVGGYIGAQLALKSSEKLVRAIFLATVAGLALKLLAYDVVYRALLRA